MAVAAYGGDFYAEGRLQRLPELPQIGGLGPHRELRSRRRLVAIDGESSAIGTPIAQGPEHAREQETELRLQRGILDEQSNDSAHGPSAIAPES
jgi:hypothetical protein